MSKNSYVFTTPVGRLVGGSVHEARTTDYDNKPLIVKTGPNAGQPRVDFSFGVAIPKTPGVAHWANEQWGAPIWALGHGAFTKGEATRPDFSWKITDGDSQIPNKHGRKPCDQEGYKGCWVIWFSGSTAPRTYNADGSSPIDPQSIKKGYYVQVCGNATDNSPSASPGLYMNHSMVALTAYGEEIISAPDVATAGFGQGVQLPPGASVTPVASFALGVPPVTPPAAPAPAAYAPPPAAPAPAAYAPPPAAPAPAAYAPPPVAPVMPPVTPNPSILNVPARNLTAKANGATYEQLLAAGWTDTMLISEGLMTV